MSGALTRILEWRPPGPVAARFMASTAPVQILNGPIGSGKTTAALMKLIRLAARQAPSTRDFERGAGGALIPIRKFKACVVRDTYRQLWKTTLPSWFKRIPRTVGTFTGAENAPASHHVSFMLSDGTLLDFQVDFIAIGENAVEDVLRGYEPTAFYLNEADLLAREVYTYARGRAGRFPDMSEGGPSWYGVLMDCNAPELSVWVYQDMFKLSGDGLRAIGVELFRQPSGLSPQAENLENLPAGYYSNAASSSPDWYVRRMIMNQPGYSRAGKPCYPEFVDSLHVPDNDLVVVRGLPLQLGLDAGLNPAAIAGQRMPNGQWRIIDEVIGEQGMGPIRFAKMLAQRLHEPLFEGIGAVRGYADPSAAYGADQQGGERTWIEIVAHEAGIRIDAAPTNKLIPRLEGVRLPLTRLIDGQPGFLLSPRCSVLREGFNAGYRFRRMKVGEENYADEPEKNEYSHPHDALQYLCSAGGEDLEIRDRRGKQQALLGGQMRQHVHDWDPVTGAAT